LKKHILLVVNPISGDVDKSKIVRLTKEFGDLNNTKIIVFETSPYGDIERLRFFQKEYLPEKIIVAGGDGTIKMVAEAMEHLNVVLGILPAGSANGLATDLNLPNSIEENLPIVFGEHFMEIDMISINGKKSLHLSDLGLNADLVKNYAKSKIRGMWGYALQTFSTLKNLKTPFFVTSACTDLPNSLSINYLLLIT
jgi:diacylglycerol kinase family enzyme